MVAYEISANRAQELINAAIANLNGGNFDVSGLSGVAVEGNNLVLTMTSGERKVATLPIGVSSAEMQKALGLYATNESLDKLQAAVNTAMVLKADISMLQNYATKQDLASVKTGGDVDLSQYALKSELSGKADDSDLLSKADKTYVDNTFALKNVADGKLDSSTAAQTYATKQELQDAALNATTPDLSGYATGEELEAKADKTYVDSTFALKSVTDGKLDSSVAETTYATKAELSQAQLSGAEVDLSGYALKTDLEALNLKEPETLEAGRRYYSPITYQWADYYNGVNSKWNKYLAFGNTLGIVILNRASGDWSTYDADFDMQGKLAKANGAKKVVFYIKTLYAAATDPERFAAEFNQPLPETQKYTHDYIVSTMVRVKKEYPDVFDGVFLDEAVNGWGDQEPRMQWYTELYQKLKAALGDDTLIVINPGSNTQEKMMEACDVVMSYESTAEKYLDPATPNIHPDFYKKYPSWRFWHVVHDVTEQNILDVCEKADTLGVGNLFLTDKTLDFGTGDAFKPDISPYDNPPADWVLDYVRAWVAGIGPVLEKVNQLPTTSQPDLSNYATLEYVNSKVATGGGEASPKISLVDNGDGTGTITL